MASTINTANIEGFDSMTPEQKVEALLGVEIPDPVDLEQYVSKEIYNKKSTEAANLSKQLKEKESALKSKATEQMTETEKLQEQMREMQAASEEALKKIQEENEALKRKDTLRDYQTNFGLLGLDEKLSGETATALVDGDIAKVFANLKRFLEIYKKSIEAELMNKTPQPNGMGGDPNQKQNAAIENARRLAKARAGNNKSFDDTMGMYLKK